MSRLKSKGNSNIPKLTIMTDEPNLDVESFAFIMNSIDKHNVGWTFKGKNYRVAALLKLGSKCIFASFLGHFIFLK